MKRGFYLSCGAALAALALGACGKGGSGANVAMEPGEWETTMELTRLDTANLPAEMRNEMRMPARRSETQRGCWTMSAGLVRIENLRFTIPEPALRGAGCTIPELVMEGGTLRGRLSCTGIPGPFAPGTRQTVSFTTELAGSYTTDTLRATASGEVRFGEHNAGGEVRITSRRLGPCPAPRPYTPPPPYVPGELGGGTGGNAVTVAPPPVPMPVPVPVPVPRVAPPAENGFRTR